MEHHERDRGHFESARNLGVDRDFRLQRQEARTRLGRPNDRLDHRLRPVEFRLRLQLLGRPRLVFGRRIAGGVYNSGSHEVWARRVDPVPGLHADLLVGRGAHLPALHAGLDV